MYNTYFKNTPFILQG